MTESPFSPGNAGINEIVDACLRAREHLVLVAEIVVSATTREAAKLEIVRQLDVSELGAEAILDQQVSSFVRGHFESRRQE